MSFRVARQAAVSLMVAFGVAACGGDATGPDGGGQGTGTITATVGGQNFNASLATAATYTENAQVGGVLSFAGTETTGAGSTRQLNVTISGINGPGTYNVGQGTSSIVVYVEATLTGGGVTTATWTSTLLAGAGTVTITEISSNRAVGTFQFTLVPSDQGAVGNKSVTSGKFNVAIQSN